MLCYSFRLILYVYGVLENDGQLIMSGSMMNNPCLGSVEISAEVHQRKIHYYSVELYPLDMDVIESLNYGEMICAGRKDVFQALHQAEWNVAVQVTDFFGLHKIQGDSNTCALLDRIDLVYFDAFAPDKQPEMWNQEIFNRLYARMTGGGVLTTYCAKGVVRRMMKEAGYSVERIPGPPGKREMLRAIKL